MDSKLQKIARSRAVVLSPHLLNKTENYGVSMPLEQFVSIGSQQAYAIWHIQESEVALLEQLYTNVADTALYTTFQHPTKRIEWLAARLTYQCLCQTMNISCLPIQKGLHDRPYIEDDQLHISLSHCFPFVGAMLSQYVPVGIDIQMPTPQLLTIQSKYLTSVEIADSNQDQDIEKLCIYWCAKEAIYKAYTHAHYSSLSFIQIAPFIKACKGNLVGNTLSGHQYLVHYKMTVNYVMAWCQEATSTIRSRTSCLV